MQQYLHSFARESRSTCGSLQLLCGTLPILVPAPLSSAHTARLSVCMASKPAQTPAIQEYGKTAPYVDLPLPEMKKTIREFYGIKPDEQTGTVRAHSRKDRRCDRPATATGTQSDLP